ncbi:MAG: twin-arginine translocation signal domain-containing protein [Planctomycetota bacterium]|jgi:hypothetical protein
MAKWNMGNKPGATTVKVNRRDFLRAGGASALMACMGVKTARGHVPAHNWDKHNFSSGPSVKNKLYQGPFPDELVPGWEVVMATAPSPEVVPNFGMGLVTYICDEVGPPKKKGESLAQSIENLTKIPLGNKLYVRLNWKDLQKHPGRLDLCDHWKITFEMAKKYNKRVGFRVMLSNPDIPGYAVPDFVAEKIPFVKLGKTTKVGLRGKVHYEPRYDSPFFQSAFKELDDLLADAYNGHPCVEYMDTYMYGFWGEGHTWPFDGNPFGDYVTAERTFVTMLEHQLGNWSKTPLTTNTQPDYSKVGNSEILDQTVRSNNWLRTDTIFIENMQIEALSNRPPWIAAAVEVGMSDGSPESLRIREELTHTDNVIYHVMDVGANYWSLWNWHHILGDRILGYYNNYPEAINKIACSIGYRLRPSWVWHYQKREHPGLVIGFVNDGIAGVPGVLRVELLSDNGKVKVGGCLDPGYPLPGKVRQAQFVLPKGTNWKGLKLKAEIEVKGVRYPVRWACHQETNKDGSLMLRQNT